MKLQAEYALATFSHPNKGFRRTPPTTYYGKLLGTISLAVFPQLEVFWYL